jgi:hypothetical protein
MTFWVTLYYAGIVVLTMGFEGQTLQQCKHLTTLIMTDIAAGNGTGMVPEDFTATCETQQLDLGTLLKESI